MMYLVEIKLGDSKIQKYILDLESLDKLIQENLYNYEYIRIIEEVDKPKIKKREK